MKFLVEFFKRSYYDQPPYKTIEKYHEQKYEEENDFIVFKKASDFTGDDPDLFFNISELKDLTKGAE